MSKPLTAAGAYPRLALAHDSTNPPVVEMTVYPSGWSGYEHCWLYSVLVVRATMMKGVIVSSGALAQATANFL
jgi:hypothetical protein